MGKPMGNPTTAIFRLYQEKKHSRRYRTDQEDFPIKDVYVSRDWSAGKEMFLMLLEPTAEASTD